MSAKQKIEELTNAWYGYALFTALMSLFQNGIGIFSLFFTVASAIFSIFVTWFIGRRLLARSSLMRMILIVGSAVFSVLGGLAVFKLVLGSWSFSTLALLALAIGSVMMNVRSLRTLTDQSVKAYCA